MAVDYKKLFLQLLPKGDAWQIEDGDDLDKLADACTPELQRIHAYLEQLIKESDPATTEHLINEWEQDWALPDTSCASQVPTSLAERQLVLDTKYTALGAQTRQHIRSILDRYGFDQAQIFEYAPGEQVPGHEGLIDPSESAYVIRIGLNNFGTYKYFTAGSSAGEPLLKRTSSEIITSVFRAGHSVVGDRLKGWALPDIAKCEILRFLHAHKKLIVTNIGD